MPLTVPKLDDRNFDQLAAEAKALIPRSFPDWTDYNASDPGITLLELFAFLIEATIYQINRVPERSLEHFAALVGVKRAPKEPIDQTLHRALEEIRFNFRAITEADFEILAQEAAPGLIARAKAVVPLDENVQNQIIKVIIVPNQLGNPTPTPTRELRQSVSTFLRQRCLITTRPIPVAPTYEQISIEVSVISDNGSRFNKAMVQQSVENAIRNFLDPLKGGTDGTGWEFGRSVFRSELYQVIEGLRGVDHVRRLLLNHSDTLPEVSLAELSLVQLDASALTVTVLDS
jgi:hypothetical protein